ncbi:MAG TPA: hypothetical protein VMQ81_14070 [Acidimicrobiia bacterium]|nr:hypothetical protein [Acidimicrobiia bacterium]
MSVWLLRIIWVSLPITAGPAAADALGGWSTGPQLVAAVLLWAAWALGVLALLAPRPVGLTLVRIVAPPLVVLAAVALLAGAGSPPSAGGALVAVLVAGALAVALPDFSIAAANGVAYGDERRYPLKTPPALFVGPVLVAPLFVAAGVAAGPLLIAADRPIAGALALVVGLPLAGVMARALHGLSRRWVVLVPAGLVVVDPLTLPDPVLFLRERIASLRPADPSERVNANEVLDLRLGARRDSLALTLDRETEFLATRRGLRGSVTTSAADLRFAAVRSRRLLADAGERRIRVGGVV